MAQPHVLAQAPLFGGLHLTDLRLDNGLRVLAVPDRRVPVVAFHVLYRVGSSYEQPGRTGMAHLLEHLMFMATEDYENGSFSATIEAAGAEGLNAWTWLDQTVYTQSVPRTSLDLVARLEASRMHRLKLEPTPFESERQVVLNERRYRVENDPEGQMRELLYQQAFDVHAYRWPTIGWKEDIEAITLDDVRAFYGRFYAPSNAVIVLAGDVAAEEAADLAQRHFGAIPSMPWVQADRPTDGPSSRPGSRAEMPLPTRTDRVQVAWRVPPWRHPDTAALQVLDAILTTGRCGRLQRALKDTGLAADLYSFVPMFTLESLFECGITARQGVGAELLEEVLRQTLDDVARNGVRPAELERARNQYRTGSFSALGTMAGKADFAGLPLLAADDWRAGVTRLEAISEVSAEDVRRVAATWLAPDRAVTVVGRARDAARIPQAPPPVVQEPVEPSPAVAERTPSRGLPDDLPTTWEAGGTRMLMVPDRTDPLVRLRLTFPAGSATDPPGRAGRALMAFSLLLRGTRIRNRRAFETALETLGARVWVDVLPDSMTLAATCLRSAWPAVHGLLLECLTVPAFAEQEVEQRRGEMLALLHETRESDGALAGLAFRENLFGPDHPYGHAPEGTERGLHAVDLADLEAFHRVVLRSPGAVMALAGDLDDGAREDLEALRVALAGPAFPQPVIPPVPALSRHRIVLVDKPERTQAQVVGGNPGPGLRDPARAALTLGNEVFGGRSFSARLIREVREKRGWSYGAGSTFVARRGGGAWYWDVFPANEQLGPTIRLVLDLLGDAAVHGFQPDEVEHARKTLVNRSPFLEETLERRLDLEIRRHLHGEDTRALLAEIAEVPAQAAERAFRQAVRPDAQLLSVVSTAAAVRAELDSLGDLVLLPWGDVAR